METYWLAFITGLTTGGVSCFAVQGSLLTSFIITNEKSKVTTKIRKQNLITFLVSKLVAYTILGLLLGFLGSKIIIRPTSQGFLQILIGIYMLIAAANLINLHPIFRYFIIRPPKFIFRLLRKQAKVQSFFTPILLGTLTVFIPCGITQAIMLLAISAGNPISSSLILFFFTLGTIPEFFLIGLAAGELFKHKAFAVVASLVVLFLGVYSINSGQILRGSVHTIQNYWSVIFPQDSTTKVKAAPIINGVQEVTITVTPRGYISDIKNLKMGIPVKLTLITNGVASCARAFTLPAYDIRKVLPQTGMETIEFTPDKLGNLTYTCSMGMYSGSFNIIK